MQQSIVVALKERVIVADGGMGTILYGKGVYLNRCYDEMNLSAARDGGGGSSRIPACGAELIETNTFGANSFKLAPHGLAERCEEINRAAPSSRATSAASVPGSVARSVRSAAALPDRQDRGRRGDRAFPSADSRARRGRRRSDRDRDDARHPGARRGGPGLAPGIEPADPREATFPAEGRTMLGYTPEEVIAALGRLAVEIAGATAPRDRTTSSNGDPAAPGDLRAADRRDAERRPPAARRRPRPLHELARVHGGVRAPLHPGRRQPGRRLLRDHPRAHPRDGGDGQGAQARDGRVAASSRSRRPRRSRPLRSRSARRSGPSSRVARWSDTGSRSRSR